MKLPFMKWYCGDWKKDPCVSMCSPATRGIWFDLLNAMHELDQSGIITGTLDSLARAGRCSLAELETALEELASTDVANVTRSVTRDGNVTAKCEIVTLKNRRMVREAHARKSHNERQSRYRARQNGHEIPQSDGEVTPYIHVHVQKSGSSNSNFRDKNNSVGEREVRAKAARSRLLPDEEFLAQLQANDAYKRLNVRLCFEKMLNWCVMNGKPATRKRLINWLNREDQPMSVPTQSGPVLSATEQHNLALIERRRRQREESDGTG